jgi:hypothetical protein
MKRVRLIRMALVAVCLATMGAAARAQPQGQPAAPEATGKPTSGERRSPPPEAVAACNTLKVDQACSFTSPKGPEKGTCVQRDASQPLACRPERRGPPPESLAACKDRKLNDACSFVSPAGKESGTCVQHEPGSALGCRPTRN